MKTFFYQICQNQPQRLSLAGLFLILLPVVLPNLFGPLGRASPSLFSEWNAPKPVHLNLLKGAFSRHTVSSPSDINLSSGLLYPIMAGNHVLNHPQLFLVSV
ncbi:O-fucosyltransferase family protein [Tripterygium wilfordii]|uniref:O-fucosyltransferase family protein n=1 Tax=Tripterygium wilfordii TaxID=458696 RepID=A0A7J7DKB3_TRIWF|nr:O-fucosyltransferase family protein [Tripterygium wilfordii]